MNHLTLISLLYTLPQNDKEVGFNSGLITILKMMGRPNETGDVPEVVKLRESMPSHVFNRLNQDVIDNLISSKVNGNKLMGVKYFKEATGFGLRESKDIMDVFYAK